MAFKKKVQIEALTTEWISLRNTLRDTLQYKTDISLEDKKIAKEFIAYVTQTLEDKGMS